MKVFVNFSWGWGRGVLKFVGGFANFGESFLFGIRDSENRRSV